jgi:hypothetical protein
MQYFFEDATGLTSSSSEAILEFIRNGRSRRDAITIYENAQYAISFKIQLLLFTCPFTEGEIMKNGGISEANLSNLAQIASLMNTLRTNEDSDKASIAISTLQVITNGSIIVCFQAHRWSDPDKYP